MGCSVSWHLPLLKAAHLHVPHTKHVHPTSSSSGYRQLPYTPWKSISWETCMGLLTINRFCPNLMAGGIGKELIHYEVLLCNYISLFKDYVHIPLP